MPSTSKQAILDLLADLSPQERAEVAAEVTALAWPGWRDGPSAARYAARLRGVDWDLLNDEEQLDFIDAVVHEDRRCA